ncbi:MAG: ABC transporter permease, partial [Planctomycetota bacterium]
ANELAAELNTTVAAVLQVRGLISDSTDTRRANRIEVLGVDQQFLRIGSGQTPFGDDWSETIILNEPLAAKLDVGPGDEVVLRIEKPGMMPRDVPLTPDSDLSTAYRLKIKAVASESEFGRFSLQANQVAPLNVFVPMQWLQEKLGRNELTNMMLIAANPNENITLGTTSKAIKKCWQLADAGLELRRLEQRDVLEMRSKRIFIDESLAEAVMSAGDGAVGILTYFVNELRLGNKTTPYSMVTAMGPSVNANSIIPTDMQDNEILINQWLADDLEAEVGDSIELSYFVLTPLRKLQEEKSSFRIRAILPMNNPAMDPNLMPDFPGLADADNCRDWDPGIAIDLDKIRERDEDYWDQYRGTPKAFVTLSAGRNMWANRYGNSTAVRYPLIIESGENITKRLLNIVDPASVGLFFQSVRARGIKAGDQATDFGQLFLGLSMFLIMAAVVLMGLVFVFGVENRNKQIGMLLAVGFSPKLVRRLLLIEGGILAIIGAIVGTAAALLYTKTMIYGLSTAWTAAVGGSRILFHAKLSTLVAGAAGAVVISMIAIWLTLRKQVSRTARELLAGGIESQFLTTRSVSKGKLGLWIAAVTAIGAVLLLVLVGAGDSSAVSMAFFGAGALLLTAGLGLTHALLKIVAGSWNKTMTSLAGLGLRNSTRRSGRSLAVVGLLACGIFLVIAVGANKKEPTTQVQKRNSGTGGFVLFGESAIGILHDLNSESGRQSMGLDDKSLEGVQVVQLRVNDGDDASCFNLNRAQRPRLLGVQPNQLQKRGAFGFTDVIESAGKEEAWDLLNRDLGEDVVPAIGDYATIFWALGKSVGDELEYSDEKGKHFRLRLVGMLKNSILQGSLVIAEDEFVRRFPSEDGYRMFLMDCEKKKSDIVMNKLSYGLKDFGLELTQTQHRLAKFNTVENTYLSIFQLLGGLGLILGSLGLGLVVLRNVLERRGEFAMLQAVGFNKISLRKLVFHEHSGLMLCGLACGIIAALVAVGPALKSPGTHGAYISLVVTIAAIGISGTIWIWIATVCALGEKMLEALRNE